MIPASTGPIRANSEFLVSNTRPHLFENPFFPATGSEVPLCRTDTGPDNRTEYMETAHAVDEETLSVDHKTQYLDVLIGCEACRNDYQSRFQK